MNNALKVVVVGIVSIVACLLIIKIVQGILGLLIPIAVIGGVCYVAYKLLGSSKSIGSGRGGILP